MIHGYDFIRAVSQSGTDERVGSSHVTKPTQSDGERDMPQNALRAGWGECWSVPSRGYDACRL